MINLKFHIFNKMLNELASDIIYPAIAFIAFGRGWR